MDGPEPYGHPMLGECFMIVNSNHRWNGCTSEAS